MDTESDIRAFIFKHRTGLKKTSRASYAFFRIVTTGLGAFLAFLYASTPSVGKIIVPDFALWIFAVILLLLFFSEIVFRMTQYSNDTYCEEGPCDIVAAKKETPWIIRIALNFPFRGLHLTLAAIWTTIGFYYLARWSFVAYYAAGGVTAIICPENFILSFLIVGAACVLDFIAKAFSFLRYLKLEKFLAEVVGTALQPADNWLTVFLKKFL